MAVFLRALSHLPNSWVEAASHARWRHKWVARGVSLAASFVRDRDSYIQGGVGKGLRFNIGRSAASYLLGHHEPEVQRLFANFLRSGMAFYDIGANVGFYSIMAARLVGSQGRVICFEPLPENVRALKHNAELNQFDQINVFEMALGGEDCRASFAVSARPTWGRLNSVGAAPAEHIGDLVVSMRRLDEIAKETNLPPPDVVKIDVEGAELDVLIGAAETLTRYRPLLIIELHGTNKPVVCRLAHLNYCAVTLNDCTSIGEAHWNSAIVAAPTEKPEAMRTILGCEQNLPIPSSAFFKN